MRTVRSNPRATVGLALVVNVALLLPSALAALALVHLTGQSTGPAARGLLGQLLPLAVPAVFAELGVVLLGGLLAYVVSEATLGRKAGLVRTWLAVRGRLAPLVGPTLLVSVVTTVLPVGFIAVGVYGGVSHQPMTLLAGLTLAVLASLGTLLPATVVMAMAGPAIVLERQGPLAALGRAFTLMRGGFWRLLGILALTALISGAASYVLRLPFTVAAAVGGAVAGRGSPGTGLTLSVLASTVAYLVTGAVVTPFPAAVTCLLYIDRRMRTEALDVVLIRAVQEPPVWSQPR